MSLLVLVVLLGMWGFVLYPLVRLRNSRVDEIRSVARFSSALRVLSAGPGALTGGRSGFAARRSRVAIGMRQLHMPPRAGIDAARSARLAAAAPVQVGAAAQRRRQVLIGAAGFFVFSLLLLAVAGMLVIQVLADLTLVAAIVVCRWSVEQERAQLRRSRRRSRSQGYAHSADRFGDRAAAPYAYAPYAAAPYAAAWDELPAAHLAGPPVMTVPLDAPPMPRRAVPPVPSSQAIEPAAAEVSRPARPSRQPAVTRPRAEPVVLAEIDIDWEPAIAEPASMVRVVELDRPRRRPVRLFDDGDEAVDIGDDSGLDVLISRRATASGW